MKIVDFNYSLASQRSINKAKVTSEIAAQRHIFISTRSVKKIISKWLRPDELLGFNSLYFIEYTITNYPNFIKHKKNRKKNKRAVGSRTGAYDPRGTFHQPVLQTILKNKYKI